MPEAAAPIAGSVIGGLMSDGGGHQQTQTKEPWAPAAPWMRDQIRIGQDLQGHYQKTPFNAQQQAGYQRLFGDLDAFRNQIAPGLMGFSNGLMGTNYQHAQPGSEAPMYSYGGGGNFLLGAPVGGLLGAPAGQGAQQPARTPPPTPTAPSGPGPAMAAPGPFSMPQAPVSGGPGFGAVDFQGLNPFAKPPAPAPTPAPAMPTDEQTFYRMFQDAQRRREREADRSFMAGGQ